MKLLGNLVAYQHKSVEKKLATLLLSEPEIKKIVTHVAEAVNTVKIGDEIITDRTHVNAFDINDQTYYVVHADQIAAILEPAS